MRPGKAKGQFLRGPIPTAWLQAASSLPGKSPLAVGLALWFRSGLEKSRTVTLSTACLEPYGLDRYAKLRGLEELERAGLIEVERQPGKNPSITIKEPNGL